MCGANSNLGGYLVLSNVGPVSGNFMHKAYLRVPKDITVRDSYGNSIDVSVQVVGHIRNNSGGWHHDNSNTTGPTCWSNGSPRDRAGVEKSPSSTGEIFHTNWGFDSGWFAVLLAVKFADWVDPNQVVPGRYFGNIVLSTNNYALLPKQKTSGNIFQSISSGQLVLDVSHVFKVNFPLRATTVHFDPAMPAEKWSSIPFTIQTNESFKIRYLCRPGGGSDFGTNFNGNCILNPSGPSQRVRFRFPHLNRVDEPGAENWVSYDSQSFNLGYAASPKVGSLEFFLDDLNLVNPGQVYRANIHVVVEADF